MPKVKTLKQYEVSNHLEKNPARWAENNTAGKPHHHHMGEGGEGKQQNENRNFQINFGES